MACLVLRLSLTAAEERMSLPAGRGGIAVVDDDGEIIVAIEHRVADAAGQSIVPEPAVTHHRDGPLAGAAPEGRGARGAESISHRRVADVERRQDRKQVAADIGADVMLAQLALDKLHRREERTFRTASAEPGRALRHLFRQRGVGHGRLRCLGHRCHCDRNFATPSFTTCPVYSPALGKISFPAIRVCRSARRRIVLSHVR